MQVKAIEIIQEFRGTILASLLVTLGIPPNGQTENGNDKANGNAKTAG